MSVEVCTFVVGPMETNTYVIVSGRQCWVIDPGIGAHPVANFLAERRLDVARIVLTHGHCDHIAGIEQVRAACPDAPVWCPAADAEMLTDPELNLSGPFGLAMTAPPADEVFEPGQTLTLGESTWQVLDTSGHTAGGVSLYCEAEAAVFTGDALFAQGVGRTDLPGGDWDRLLANIRENLLSLPTCTKVYPGHGPGTTIDLETRVNPFLRDA